MVKEMLWGAIISGVSGAAWYGCDVAMSNGSEINKWIWATVVMAFVTGAFTLIYGVLSYFSTNNPKLDRVMLSVRDSVQGTIAHMRENFAERPFWIYLFMLGILAFVRLTFFIFHVWFPTLWNSGVWRSAPWLEASLGCSIR